MFRRRAIPRPTPVVLAVMLTATSAIAQAPAQATGPGGGETSNQMVTPTPMSGEGYSMEFAAETPRTNYVTGGLNFISAYDNDVTSNSKGPVSDVSYTILPTIGLAQSRSRLNWNFIYSPGFTFYQKTSQLNQDDQNLNFGFQYRLSPHVALGVFDNFHKTSNALSTAGQSLNNTGIGGVLNPTVTVIAPVAEQISNGAAVNLSYQFAANSMVGASGTFSFLEFPNRQQAAGFSNSHARGGNAFYTRRFSGRHYIGVSYGYQEFTASQSSPSITPLSGLNTESHSISAFYTFYLKPTISFSVNAGPERTSTGAQVEWIPSFGGSVGWRGPRTSIALSGGYTAIAGLGLPGASKSSTGQASIRRQLASHLTAGIGANYSDNKTLGPVSAVTNGHTIGGDASAQIVLAEHLGLELGYARFHQNYSNFANSPDRYRTWISLSYRFQRPIGR